MGIEFKDKIMLYCFREVKYKQGFTIEIWYYLYNALGSTYNAHQWPSGWREGKVPINFLIFLGVLMKK